MIKYEIEGGHLPVVICYPEAGQTLCTETGAMSWMSPNMRMNTTTGGGIRKMFGRMFTGESLFMNEYTAEGGEGMIAFASCFPGSIIPYHVTPDNPIVVQKKGFLAMEKGLELSVYFQKRLGGALFGGEGFIMQKIEGDGMVFIEIDGHCKEYNLGPFDTIIVDTGYLAAMSASCQMDVEMVKGAKNLFFGGEGIFHTRIQGPGKVYIQSMPIIHTAERLAPYLEIHTHSSSGSSGNNGGGFNIKFGD